MACNTPSVPIPPPVLAALRFHAAPAPGKVVVQGDPNPNHASARFYIYNQTSGDGVITTAAADGAFTTDAFDGADGDTARIYYDTLAGERSQEACVQLQLDAGLISQRCP
ncbi:MAG TPA: hypothetical protein VMZ28_00635 [Kofleriaceae bacterium]|nr:hypothetical protein [Kofleriaceae bacterium]